MSDVHYLVKVPVGELRKGLYVAEPDRPWTEVPLAFQGLVITTDDELETLRQYCEFVYVERERSRQDALEALDDAAADPAAGAVDPTDAVGDREGPAPDITAITGRGAIPDRDRFARAVEQAHSARSQVSETLDQVLGDVRMGRSVDTQEARDAVATMTAEVADNTSAAMWLTRLSSRHDYIRLHSLDVCVLSLAFGRSVGLQRERLQHIGLGALLHDIGKIEWPDELLDKSGPLTGDEWKLVRKHPERGREIAGSGGDVPDEVLEIIGCHHERIDGHGYPRGLRGKALPADTRIVAIANAYDSRTSDRPYRGAEPADDVLQRFYNEGDSLYGPKLTQAFIRCVGIFPIGSLVELDNGALAIVLGVSPEDRLKPTVLLVRTPGGEYYEKRVLLNLADTAGGRGPARYVRRVVNPGDYDIDVAQIVALEFGVVM